MPREAVVVKLTRAGDGWGVESTVLRADRTWTSAPGGWLPVQTGRWVQLPGDVRLRDGGSSDVVQLLGLVFDTVRKSDAGRANYLTLRDSGTWEVVDVVP